MSQNSNKSGDKPKKRTRRKAKTSSMKSEVKALSKVIADSRVSGARPSTQNSLAPGIESAVKRIAKYGKSSYIEKQTYKYLLGLLNPSIPNMPGPLIGRTPGMKTQMYQVVEIADMQANASGFCCAGIALDCWFKDPMFPNQPYARDPLRTVLSTVSNGTCFMATNNNYVGTVFPIVSSVAAGVTNYALGGTGATISTIIPGAIATTQFRLISASLSVAPDMTALSNSGQLLVGQYPNIDATSSAIPNSIVNGKGVAELGEVPSGYQLTKIFDVPQWEHGKEVTVAAIPSGQTYGRFYGPVATGITAGCPHTPIWMMAQSCVVNSIFRLKATFNYEVTTVPSYLASTMSNKQVLSHDNVPGKMPATDLMQQHTAPDFQQVESVSHAAPMKVMLHEKALNEPITKDEGKSWLSDVSSAAKTGVSVASTIAEVAGVLGAVLL